MMRSLLSTVFVVLLCGEIHSQVAAWESNLAANYSISGWMFNTSMGHRSIREQEDKTTKNSFVFLEANQFITRKISSRLSVSIGYKYRDINNLLDEVEQRLTQQVAYLHQNTGLRMASRLRLEQRFMNEFAHRYRYRFSIDFPLNGAKLDVKEYYLAASNEFLLEQLVSSSSFDNRFTLGLGYLFTNSCKFQLDITHRMEGLNSDTSHIPFITTSVIFNID